MCCNVCDSLAHVDLGRQNPSLFSWRLCQTTATDSIFFLNKDETLNLKYHGDAVEVCVCAYCMCL